MAGRGKQPTAARCRDHPDADVAEDYAAGDLICRACGVIVAERILDVGSEWRTFGSSDKKKGNDDPSRVGGPGDILLDGSELSTTISTIKGVELPWAKWAGRSALSKSNARKTKGFAIIKRYASLLELPEKFVEKAKLYYKEVDDAEALQTRRRETKAAVCIFIACRELGLPKTIKDLQAVSKLQKKELQRCIRAIRETLGVQVKTVEAGAYMAQLCPLLGMGHPAQLAAVHVEKTARMLGLVSGHNPRSVSAAAIYLVCQVLRAAHSARDVWGASGVSEIIIKKIYKELYPVKEYLFPADFVFERSLREIPNLGPATGPGLAGPAAVARAGLAPVDGEPPARFAASAAGAGAAGAGAAAGAKRKRAEEAPAVKKEARPAVKKEARPAVKEEPHG